MSYMVSAKGRKITTALLNEIVTVPEWIDEDLEDTMMELAFKNGINWKLFWINCKIPAVMRYRTEVIRWMYSQPKYRSVEMIATTLGIRATTVTQAIAPNRPPIATPPRRPEWVPEWVMAIVIRVAAEHKLHPNEMWGDFRGPDIRACRDAVYRAVYSEMTNKSYSAIGRWFMRDHATIMAAVKGPSYAKKNRKKAHCLGGPNNSGGSDERRQDAA